MNIKGLVVFSFALCKKEPSKCNIRLAKTVERIIAEENYPLIIVSQWEVARQLTTDGVCVDHIVELRPDKSFLGSEQVWQEAMELFRNKQITEVIPVAHTFLHMVKIKYLIRTSGFKVINRKIDWIGFDKNSTQWWTRGPISLLLYSIFQIFGLHGHFGKQKYDID